MGSVRFTKFEWDRAGYKAVLDSAGVQAVVDEKARSVASTASAMLDSDEGYHLEDFEVKEFQGRLATGRVVRTKTDHARYSQAKNKTLTKALKGA